MLEGHFEVESISLIRVACHTEFHCNDFNSSLFRHVLWYHISLNKGSEAPLHGAVAVPLPSAEIFYTEIYLAQRYNGHVPWGSAGL